MDYAIETEEERIEFEIKTAQQERPSDNDNLDDHYCDSCGQLVAY